MRSEASGGHDWRDGAAYAPLLGADRSLIAWEWLRRDPDYVVAARTALGDGGGRRRADPRAAQFGLVGFEPPALAVPEARPMWRRDIHPRVLRAEPAKACGDLIESAPIRPFATLICGTGAEHLLLCDGLRAIRLDGPIGTFCGEALSLSYHIEGLERAERLVLTLRRFLALCRRDRFAPSLHAREPRAGRWLQTLRAWDGLRAGANQREIAEVLLSQAARSARWRTEEPSLRAQVQRLVRSARRFAARGYVLLLA